MSEIGKEVVTQAAGFNFASIIPTIITAGITFLAGLLVNRQGNNQFFSSIVSKERMIWIREMRKLCSDLCTICESYSEESNLSPEALSTYLKAKNGILLHLNDIRDPNKQLDFPYDKELFDLLNDKSFSDIKEKTADIREKATAIFKTEWDKVKIEAGNSRYKIWKIQRLQKSLSGKKKKRCFCKRK